MNGVNEMSENNNDRTPQQIAQGELNKKIARAIADRLYQKKNLEAQIKKLDKEIAQIENGELVPKDSSYDESSQSSEL